MASTSTKVGHGLAKVLGIKLDYRNETNQQVTRGESTYSVNTADEYVEEEPTSLEWIQETLPSGKQVVAYVHNLFPFTKWILHYNVQWLIGDLVAGITIGAVVVPQSMAYANLANLAPEFGLYSSFMGVLIYWFFATSKDITIGPVAVMSTIVGNVVSSAAKKDPSVPGHVVASALAIICGAIVAFLGLFRLGRIVELIPLVSICAFMTGSAINIAVGQVPTLMGITVPNSRGPTYEVIIQSLKHLGTTKLDAALGLTALFLLYFIRFVFNYLAKKNPANKKAWFFCNTLRSVFVILLYILVGWAVNRHLPDHSVKSQKKSPFKILGPVPRGFQHAGVPKIDTSIIKLFVDELPSSVIVLLIEHISISKSFGRINNYQIDPSQELVAIGVTNLLAPFLGAYPATGSFSRTAIKAKAGVRTPFAGVITAVVVLLAIYALPAMFFYIPNASLAAVIIHAVGDLITPPNTVYQFWRISPLEVFIFFAGVLVTIFSSIDNGIYTTVAVSAALFLWRALIAKGRFLGRVKVRSVVADAAGEESKSSSSKPGSGPDGSIRNIFLPIDHKDGSNPLIQAAHPYPGVFVYRFSEGYNYPNANNYLDYMVETIFQQTRRTNPNLYPRLGDRPWNNPGPRRGKPVESDDHKPTLKAVVLDFASVNNTDVTSVQHLIDVRNQLDLYTQPERVQWHFANINNRWTKRALVSAGFGYPSSSDGENFQRWKPIFSVADMSAFGPGNDAEERIRRRSDVEFGVRGHVELRDAERSDSESRNSLGKSGIQTQVAGFSSNKSVALVQGINRPFFHIDLTSAVQSAIHHVVVQSRLAEDVPVTSGESKMIIEEA